MKTATSIKLEPQVKKQADKLAKDLGISLSSMINASLKQIIAEQQVTFIAPQKINTKMEAELLKQLHDIKHHKHISGPFNSIEDLRKSLLK